MLMDVGETVLFQYFRSKVSPVDSKSVLACWHTIAYMTYTHKHSVPPRPNILSHPNMVYPNTVSHIVPRFLSVARSKPSMQRLGRAAPGRRAARREVPSPERTRVCLFFGASRYGTRRCEPTSVDMRWLYVYI